MSILTFAQAQNYAAQAGFSGNSLSIVVAIAQAESSLNTSAQHTNGDGSIDRGILQINSRWHAEVSDSCAYDAACSFSAAYRISSGGTDFNQWAVYTSGVYLRYLTTAGIVPQGKAWYQYPITNPYLPNAVPGNWDSPHFGIDFATPVGTPFFFPKSGTIVAQDYGPWGGEEYLKPDDKSTEELVGHLDLITTQVGQHVEAGQVTGYTGGQTSGGNHPTSPQYSSGPHTIFQYYTGTATGEQGLTVAYGPDVTPLVNEILTGQIQLPGSSTNSTENNALLSYSQTGDNSPIQQKQNIATTVHNVLVEVPGFSGIALALDVAEQFPGIIWYEPGKSYQVVAGGWLGDIINSNVSGLINIGTQDYVGAAMRSIIDTIFSNMVALFFRLFIISVGLFLMGALIWKFIMESGVAQDALKVAKDALSVAAVAA